MYIYGRSRLNGATMDAFPCFICKKMIINSGIENVICSLQDEEKKFMVFSVEDWIKEWQQSDIIEDKYKYKG
jgi:dCMP deaminase